MNLHASRYKDPQGGFQGHAVDIKVIPICISITFFISNPLKPFGLVRLTGWGLFLCLEVGTDSVFCLMDNQRYRYTGQNIGHSFMAKNI